MFQHTAARRRLVAALAALAGDFAFQHTAARRRLVSKRMFMTSPSMFQHTAARRRLGNRAVHGVNGAGFNTQPPEGGCVFLIRIK